MGVLWGFPILLPACTSHHCHHSTPGWILGLISMSSQGCGRLRMRCFFFPQVRRRVMLCAYLKPLQIPGGAPVCWGAFWGAHSDTCGRGGETTSSSHRLHNSIHGIKTRSEREKCIHKGLYLTESELSSGEGSSVQLAGDPAHLEFQLWLMTQQIEPVIFRHDVSCPFGPRKQPPPSKTAVSQWCSPFSPIPSRGKAGAAGLGVRGAALGTHHPPPHNFSITLST